MTTHGAKGGPAFEIRFCKGNKVQVFDLSKRWHVGGKQPLPNEYQEDDVINGRLRYSKLGNQWITYNSMDTTNQPQRPHRVPTTPKPDAKADVVPALAKQRAIEDAKELEHIRQAQEAMQKAMDRKKKIEMARLARKNDKENVTEGAASNLNLETLAGNKDDDQKDAIDNRNVQDPLNKLVQEQILPTKVKNGSTKINKKSSLLHETGPPPTTPLPKRHYNNYDAVGHTTNDRVNQDRSLPTHETSSLTKPLPSHKHAPSRTQTQGSFHQDNGTVNPKPPSSVWCCIIS